MGAEHVARWKQVAEVAARQHGCVTTAQLRACGVRGTSIERAVDAGRLWRIHRGVYAVGHPALTGEGRWHAAVLACRGGVLSHRPAGVAWQIHRGELARVEVTVSTGGTHRRPGILIHSSALPVDEVTEWEGIPITTPARTAVDLAHEFEDADRVHGLLRQLQYRRRFDLAALRSANARRPNALLGATLDDLAPTESPLEDAFRTKVIRRHRLPEPDFQARVQGMRVDLRWSAARLTVEIYGNHHVNPAMLQTDAARDNILGLGGDLVLRYLPADIHRRHARTAAQIRQALADRHGSDHV